MAEQRARNREMGVGLGMVGRGRERTGLAAGFQASKTNYLSQLDGANDMDESRSVLRTLG